MFRHLYMLAKYPNDASEAPRHASCATRQPRPRGCRVTARYDGLHRCLLNVPARSSRTPSWWSRKPRRCGLIKTRICVIDSDANQNGEREQQLGRSRQPDKVALGNNEGVGDQSPSSDQPPHQTNRLIRPTASSDHPTPSATGARRTASHTRPLTPRPPLRRPPPPPHVPSAPGTCHRVSAAARLRPRPRSAGEPPQRSRRGAGAH